MTDGLLFKVLDDKGQPYHGGSGQWYLPKGKRPGTWMPKIDPLVLCQSGYHLCRPTDLLTWLGPTIWLAEARGERIDESDKIVVSSARLLRQLPWDERSGRLFSCACAERVVHLNPDPRVRAAIDTARKFANGAATRDELDAAGAAAWAAAGAAAWDAAGDAAWAAARAAARDARDVAWAAAEAAARAAERQWQADRLMQILGVGL